MHLQVKYLLYIIFYVVFNFYHVQSRWDCSIQSIPQHSLSYTAQERCLYQCASKNFSDECMLSCYDSWLFTNRDRSRCVEAVQNSSEIACNPTTSSVEIFEVPKKLNNGQVVSFMYMKWKPCVGGIRKLKGFNIVLQINPFDIHCFNLQLARVLEDNIENQNMQFGYIVPLEYNQPYLVSLLAYPYAQQHVSICRNFQSSTCEKLNGERSCFCSCDSLPAPNVTVSGYDVDVLFPAAKDCFNPVSYLVIFCVYKKHTDCNGKSFDAPVSHPKDSPSFISHRFRNVYDSDDAYSFAIKVNVEYEFEYERLDRDCLPVKNTAFRVQAWKPPQPNVTTYPSGRVKVFFPLPPNYNITRFNVSLKRYYEDDKADKEDDDNVFRILDADSAVDGILSTDFYQLSDGMYTAEIREVRPDSEIYNVPKWGPRITFSVKREIDILIVVVIFSFAVVVFFIFLLFYCVRKGVLQQGCDIYRKIQKISSSELPAPTAPSPQRKKVFLIWQADNRSEELERAQELVIKRFVAFLTHVCGIDVTVDLYEQINLSRKYSAWIDEARNEADWIVFVCPHFDYSNRNQSRIGNFSHAFRYLETHSFERSNFITVVFEHANLELTDDTRALRRLSSGIYRLMDDIDGFYFHTQGFSKSWYFVWLLHRYISFRGYVGIPEGQELDLALKNMTEKIERFDSPRDELEFACSSAKVDDDSERSSIHSETSSLAFSVQCFTYTTNSSVFPCKERPPCKSMTSLVGNENEAKEAIRKLNQQSSLEEPHSHYPCQNTADQSEEERERLFLPSRVFYSVDESCVYHRHVFGEECRRCDDDVTSSVRLGSDSNDETLPKSPGNQEIADVELNNENNSINDQMDSNGDSGVFPYSGDMGHSTIV